MKIAIITNVIPSYREGFYDRLFSRDDLLVTVYCQSRIPGMNLKTIHSKFRSNIKLVNFVSANRERCVWQFLPWKEIIWNYDVVFVNGNPRVISDVVLGTFLMLLRRKVVLWTMAHSFRANVITEKLRLLWSRLFQFLFVYTDAEVDYLRKRGFTRHCLVGMNNGLDQTQIDCVAAMWSGLKLEQWRAEQGLDGRIMVLSCARLEPKNKFDLFAAALPLVVREIPNLLWCIIGDGTERTHLERMLSAVGLSTHVRFVGELYVEEDLAPWFLSAEILVHPAAIGLSIPHAFGYGLPVVTHGNSDLHGPEYGAFESETTGRNFEEDNIQNLAETVTELLRDSEARLRMKDHVLRIAREQYNVDVMVKRFVHIAKLADIG